MRAFAKFDRRDFVPPEIQNLTHHDWALPIGHDQTISQPTTVKLMLHWLGAKEGDKALDVGSGSGWTAALLSYIVGPKGKVYAVEKIPELVEFGHHNAKQAKVNNAEFFQAGDKLGLPDQAPFDRILVSAAADELPTELINQLKPNGKMVIPIKYDILEITKDKKTGFKTITHPGFVFVPLV